MPVPPGSTKARRPTNLKILSGTFRPSLANKDEPKPLAEIPPAPAHLDADEQAAWKYFSEILGPFRIVTKQDEIALERLACCLVEVRRAQEVIRQRAKDGKTDPTYESVGPKGTTMRRVEPIFSALAEAERRLRDWLGRFGLTPADRSRVSTGENGNGKKRKEDEFA